jgi:hypothetical protein
MPTKIQLYRAAISIKQYQSRVQIKGNHHTYQFFLHQTERTIESRAFVTVVTRPERSIGCTIGLLLVKPYATFFTELVAACKPNAEAQQKLLARMMKNFMLRFCFLGIRVQLMVYGKLIIGDC